MEPVQQSRSVEAIAAWKREAAQAAAAEIGDGAVVGLGSGTTAEALLEDLAARIRQGLHVTGVPTSQRTQELAMRLGIPVADLDAVATLDLSIDGADEVTLPDLALVKGHGGALLREKLVAATSRRRIIIVDETKLVNRLGDRHAIPVEVIAFGWRHTAERLATLGLRPSRRPATGHEAEGENAPPYVTDGGHYILDCTTGPIAQPAELGRTIKMQVGVVEHGLFLGMTERVIAAGQGGVRVYDRQV